MDWIMVLKLALFAGNAVVQQLKKGGSPITQELADEAQAGLDKLQAVHDKAVSLAELESLRTTALW